MDRIEHRAAQLYPEHKAMHLDEMDLAATAVRLARSEDEEKRILLEARARRLVSRQRMLDAFDAPEPETKGGASC